MAAASYYMAANQNQRYSSIGPCRFFQNHWEDSIFSVVHIYYEHTHKETYLIKAHNYRELFFIHSLPLILISHSRTLKETHTMYWFRVQLGLILLLINALCSFSSLLLSSSITILDDHLFLCVECMWIVDFWLIKNWLLKKFLFLFVYVCVANNTKLNFVIFFYIFDTSYQIVQFIYWFIIPTIYIGATSKW